MQDQIPKNQAPHCRHGNKIPYSKGIGQLFRDHSEEYINTFHPDKRVIKLIRNIRQCKTPALGGQKIVCKDCSHETYMYFSCGNSSCPQCQGIKRKQWQDKLSTRMLKTPYVHTTFTLPHDLNGLAKRNKHHIYSLLFRSAWKTIKSLCKEESNVGGLPGMIAVLHTWGSDMKYHVHVHTLVTFGGLDKKGNWKWPKRKNKIARYRSMSAVFRSSFLDGLEKLMDDSQLVYHQCFEQIKSEMIKKRWVVHNTFPTADATTIKEYLSRYVCKIAITDNRLTYNQGDKKVILVFNNYKNQLPGEPAPKESCQLDPLVAMGQFLQHQLPPYFPKIRYYGLHASSTYKKVKGLIPEKIKAEGQTVRTIFQIIAELIKATPYHCPKCASVDYISIPLTRNNQWMKLHVKNYNPRPPPAIRLLTYHKSKRKIS